MWGGGVRRDLTEFAGQPGLDRVGVKGLTAAHQHEVVLTGLDHFGGTIEKFGVQVVDHDRPAVDPAGGIAPLCEAIRDIKELLAKSRCGCRPWVA